MSRQLPSELAPWFADPENPDVDPKAPVDPKVEGAREDDVDSTQKESKEPWTTGS
ncbi:MAG: hypothetical protein GY851_10115 [bacterium]|nr:hypothetical protein [bacterium]